MKEELMKLRGQYVTAKLEYETLAAEIQANAQAVKSAVDTFTHYGSMPMRDPLVRQLANTAANSTASRRARRKPTRCAKKCSACNP